MRRSVSILLLTAILSVTAYAPGLAASGTRSEVWGYDIEELRSRLASGNHEFLRHVDFFSSGPSGPDIREARRLGDEGLHLLGLVYADLDLPRTSERLLRLAWSDSPEPWSRASLDILLDKLESEERYAELARLAAEGIDRYGDDAALLRYRASGLYQLERDEDLLAALAKFPDLDPESALWLAVASSRRRADGWEQRYRELFADFGADDAHSRTWVYIGAQPRIAESFTAQELTFFRAKQLLAEGRTVSAAETFAAVVESVISAVPAEETSILLRMLLSPASLRDIYLSGSLSGRQSATAGRLLALANVAMGGESPDPSAAGLAREYAGRLYRTAGNYMSATDAFESSLLSLPSGSDAERVRWYLLSSRVRADPAGAAAVVSRAIPDLPDPYYYTDLFEELARRLSELQLWETLLDVYATIRDFASPGTRATYELILAEAIEYDLLAVDIGQPLETRKAYLQRAASQEENLYGAFVALAALGETGESLMMQTSDARSPSEGPVIPGKIEAMLAYGLLDRAYSAAVAETAGVSDMTLLRLAEHLALAGQVRESIRVAELVGRRLSREGAAGSTPLEVMRLVYPQGFAAVFEEVLPGSPAGLDRTAAVDRWLLYALVREESRFDPEIESSAGAVGLTQLLPATAEDVARRIRLASFDLTDPSQNLRIGASYMGMLESQFGGLVKALAAYNAGQGRVRSWERLRPDLDGLLFHQSIPFNETYNHIRQVVVSAVYYGYLYGDRTPTDTIRLVFGDTLMTSED